MFFFIAENTIPQQKKKIQKNNKTKTKTDTAVQKQPLTITRQPFEKNENLFMIE